MIGDRATYTSDNNAMLSFDTYADDDVYRRTMKPGHLRFARNLYYNPRTFFRADMFSNNRKSSAAKGALHSFSGWQEMGQDEGSEFQNPELNALAEAGSGKGWQLPKLAPAK